MEPVSYKINQKEEKERKQWLLATICFFVFYPIFVSAFLSERVQISKAPLYLQLLSTITGLISLWIIWHCAYRKHGTSLLTWWLVISPFRFIKSILGESCNNWIIGEVILDISIYAWWYILSLKLRKINKKIQIFAFLSSDDYRKAVDSIRSAQNLDDLTFEFHEAFRECPGHFSKALSPVYEEMKQHLLKQQDQVDRKSE